MAAASWLFVVVTGGVGVYAATQATTDYLWMLLAATALVVGSLVGVATSNSGNRFTTGLAVAAAIPFVFSGADGVDLAGTIGAYGIGLAVVWVLRGTPAGRATASCFPHSSAASAATWCTQLFTPR